MKQSKKMLFVLLTWSITTFVWSETAGDVLWEKLGHILSMHASFTQKIETKKRELSRTSGTMDFERPGHFRWQTKTPMKQLLVADGEKFWIYDVELEQVTVRAQSQIEGAAVGLFLGDDRERFFREFTVTQPPDSRMSNGKTEVFDLQATSKQANIQRMMLCFEDNNLLREMILYDQLGQRTMITFTHVQNNLALKPRLFQFEPPAGVDVVEQ